MKIKDIQNDGIEILKDVTTLLEQNNIRYHLDYGTQLGATRHEDVIPWDYDFDIGCSIKDYDKLKDVLSKYDKYDIHFNHEEKYNKTLASIVIYSKKKNLYYDKERKGIYLDIFVYDYSSKPTFLFKNLLKLEYFKQATRKTIHYYGYINTIKLWKLKKFSSLKIILFIILYFIVWLVSPITWLLLLFHKKKNIFNFSTKANLFALQTLNNYFDKSYYDGNVQKTAKMAGNYYYEFVDIDKFLINNFGNKWTQYPTDEQIKKQIIEQFPHVVRK